MSAKPHISPALLALRGWVMASAITLAVCALIQLGVFSVVRYTDARTTVLQPPPNAAIVVPKEQAGEARAGDAPAGARKVARSKVAEPVDPNIVRSVTDRNLELTASVATSAGLIAAIALLACTLLGAGVAAGGGVPGVEYAVRSVVWSAVIMGACLPWSGLAGRGMVAGVFCGYEVLGAAAAMQGFPVVAGHVLMPLAVVALSGCVAWWFRRGTVCGVILTSMSEVDEALEREMAQIRERGVGRLNPGGRATGVLHQIEPQRMAVADPAPLRKAAGAESLSADDSGIAPSLLRRKSPPPQRPI